MLPDATSTFLATLHPHMVTIPGLRSLEAAAGQQHGLLLPVHDVAPLGSSS